MSDLLKDSQLTLEQLIAASKAADAASKAAANAVIAQQAVVARLEQKLREQGQEQEQVQEPFIPNQDDWVVIPVDTKSNEQSEEQSAKKDAKREAKKAAKEAATEAAIRYVYSKTLEAVEMYEKNKFHKLWIKHHKEFLSTAENRNLLIGPIDEKKTAIIYAVDLGSDQGRNGEIQLIVHMQPKVEAKFEITEAGVESAIAFVLERAINERDRFGSNDFHKIYLKPNTYFQYVFRDETIREKLAGLLVDDISIKGVSWTEKAGRANEDVLTLSMK